MRPDRASCAICMETLFNKLDDLDDVVPIVAPGCGHVFHESCLHQWFDSQASSYIAAMRAQGPRESSPTASEAPAECPTCRQECFMDENSKYETTRLYINWGEQDGSSVAGSSPVRPHTQKARRGPNELLGLARRAKGLAEEAGDQSADSQMADVQSMLHRSEGLRKDLEEQQEKGVEGIRRYVGGLTAAINKLSTNLVSNPTSAALQMQLAAQEHKVAEQERRIHDILNRVIPDQIAAAKREEKKKGDHHYAKLKKDLDTLEQELQQEKVARRNLKKGMVEKFELMEAKVDQAKKDEERERRCRESLQADLNERTMQLRALQAKTKSRKDLATELKDVRAELAALKEQNTELSKRKHSVSRLDRYGSSSSSPSKRPRLADIDNFDGHDKPTRPPSPFLQRRAPDEVELSIQELSPTTYSQLVSTGTGQNHRSDPLDESLQIDMESFDRGRSPPDPFDLLDSLDNPIRPQQKAKSAVRGNTTARSFTSDQFAGPSRRAAVPISRTGSSSSKYFTNTADRQSESKTNPFSSTKADTEKRKKLPSGPTVMVPSSSDNEDTQAPPSCRPARQDFTLSSTNPARAVLRTLSQPTALSSRPKEAVRKPSGQPSIVAALGLADKNGRPMKGLAMGARAGRRA